VWSVVLIDRSESHGFAATRLFISQDFLGLTPNTVPSVQMGVLYLDVSLEESVGEVRFGKGSESVIERGFVGFLGTETVGFSGDQF